MSRERTKGIAAAVVALAAMAAPAWTQDSGPVAAVSVGGAGVTFQPVASSYGSLRLTVTGPDGFVFEENYANGTYPSFSVFDGRGARLPDGAYTWELVATPRVSKVTHERLARMRAEGRRPTEDELLALGIPPADQLVQSGGFRLQGGSVVGGDGAAEPAGGFSVQPTTARGSTSGIVAEDTAPLAQVFTQDVSVQGSLCTGFDCVNGESFGFDTFRLKENNLRIHFNDTSNSGSFPTRDWRIAVNGTNNGDAEYFAIQDAGTSRDVLYLLSDTRANAIATRDNRVGFGTSSPVTTLHNRYGDTPTLRLEQDGSSGFQAQTWDLASNEANFFIRDVTNGSKLPFRIKPGAPDDSVYIAADGYVGLGTANPSEAIHIHRTSGEANLRLQTTANAATEFQLANAGGEWQFIHGAGGAFNLNRVGVAGNQFVFTTNGSLVIQGSLTASGGSTFPDYVFDPDYELMPLSDLSDFVTRERHLPGVMSRHEVREKGGVDVTRLQLQMLEKIEELTLHILRQQEEIERLKELYESRGAVEE